jgi:hypothetical protein
METVLLMLTEGLQITDTHFDEGQTFFDSFIGQPPVDSKPQ